MCLYMSQNNAVFTNIVYSRPSYKLTLYIWHKSFNFIASFWKKMKRASLKQTRKTSKYSPF